MMRRMRARLNSQPIAQAVEANKHDILSLSALQFLGQLTTASASNTSASVF
ncbi:MAG: hypothetical protein ACLRME_10515 [Faecalibacterium prausnitzii]